ncbi:MAG: hypothetical protein MI919_37730 [Holophagales bacterium]|nr:hypothetical protein [Holophagales bacterium]
MATSSNSPESDLPAESRQSLEFRQLFAEIRERIRSEIRHGRLESASSLAEQAVSLARRHGEPADIDLAICNRASILVAQGRGREGVAELRLLLMRGSDPRIQLQAADSISGWHAHQDQVSRALFYARLALDHAESLGELDARIKTHNNLGQLSLRDSRFADARDHFRTALELMGGDTLADGSLGADGNLGLSRAVVLSNLAYCECMEEEIEAAFAHAFQSLRGMLRADVGSWEMYPRLVLSHAYLDIGRYSRSIRHARRGLELADRPDGNDEWVKNALYLLGEAEKLRGHTLEAYDHFSDLQGRFYPDEPFIVSLLMTTDIRGMINLMAKA